VAAVLLLPLKRRLAHELPIPVRLDLEGRATWFWFSDSSELFALEEIFNGGEYAAVDGARPKVIVDLGANVGQAALWFRSRFPNATMLCVEPDPVTFAKLRRNLESDPLVTLRQAAITAGDGSVQIERTRDSSWATRVREPGTEDAERVPAVSLETLLDDHDLHHVDLLKVDIEGLEHDALGESPALARTSLVVGEIHPDLLRVPAERALEDMRNCGRFDHCDLRGDIFVLSRETRATAQT
jgi:FkbM family methyltransferase